MGWFASPPLPYCQSPLDHPPSTVFSNKKYFNHFDPSPEFVIAFLACEAFYSVAIREDPGLIEYCLEKKVVLASPVTLIALLKVIEFGWRQGDTAENHEEVSF